MRSRKVEDFLKYSVLCEKLGGVCVHSFCKNYLWYSVCQNDLDYSFPCVDFFHESNVYNQGVETIFLPLKSVLSLRFHFLYIECGISDSVFM